MPQDGRVEQTSLKPPTSGRRDEVEQAILAGCKRLLERKPFAQISIEDLAGEADIQRTAFYFYFANKQDVLARLIEQIADELYAAAESWLSGSESTHEALEQALGRMVDIFTADRALVRAAVEVSTYVPEMGDFWRALVGRFIVAAEERIKLEQSQQRARPGIDARPTAEALVWMTERCGYQLVAIEGRPSQELVRTLASIWTNAVMADDQEDLP